MISKARLETLVKEKDLVVLEPLSWCPHCGCLKKPTQGVCPKCYKDLAKIEERIIADKSTGGVFCLPISEYRDYEMENLHSDSDYSRGSGVAWNTWEDMMDSGYFGNFGDYC